jgi:hypothetical protein
MLNVESNLDRPRQKSLPTYLYSDSFYTFLDHLIFYYSTLTTLIFLSAFRPRGVPGLTSKIVAACPSPDGLARDGTQGGKCGSCYPAPGGCARSRGYKRSRGGERVSLFISPFSRVTLAPPPRRRGLDLPFIDARRGSRSTVGGVAGR